MSGIRRLQPRLEAAAAFPPRAAGWLPWRRWRVAKAELCHLPFWVFPWTAGSGPAGAWAVEAISGSLRLLSTADWREAGEGPATGFELPFFLDREDAIQVVEEEAPLHLPLLRRAGIGALPRTEAGEALFYPFWVGYLERRGRLRPQLADARSGAPGGPALVRAFLMGLAKLPPGPTSGTPGEPRGSGPRGSPPAPGPARE